ncbi:hypothetical protein Tco_0445553 [Tanacetum coccineum]
MAIIVHRKFRLSLIRNHATIKTFPCLHLTCYSGDENSFTYDSNLNFVDDSPNPPPQPPTYSYEFCGNDAHYGHDCPPQVPFIYNPEPCYNQDFNFPQNFQSFQQQYIYCTRCGGPHETFQCQQVIFYEPCCENCGGPHETFQCQPMNQNFDNSNSSGFDQFQPPQYPVIHHPPQETSVEMLQARENLMESIQTFLKKFNRISFRETPKVLLLAWENFFEIKHACKEKQHQPEDIQELLRKLLKDVQIISEELADFINTPNWNRPAFCNNDDDDDDDEEYTIAVTPVLPTVEPDNSLSMGDEHLRTIPEKEQSGVEDLVPIPSESKGIFDSMCDVPFCDNSPPLDVLNDHFEIFSDFNDDCTSSDDDSFKDIDYIDASPPDSKLVSLEEVKDFNPENGEIDTNILLTIKDNILRLSSYNSLPAETFCFNLEEKSSGNPTSYTDLSLPDYEAFFCDSEPNSGDFTMDVVEDIFDNPSREPRVHALNILPALPTIYLDSDFTLSSDSLGSDLVFSFPSGTRNKIFDPGIFIEVQSKRFLSLNEFSISFIRDTLSLVFDTLLPFHPKMRTKFSILIISDFSESSMMIYGEEIPILDVLIVPDYETSRVRGFVLRSLELQSFA